MRELSMLEVESVMGGDGWTCTPSAEETTCVPDANSQQTLAQAYAEAMAISEALKAAREAALRASSGHR